MENKTDTFAKDKAEYSLGFVVGMTSCLCIAALIGFVGNLLVLAVLTRTKKFRTVMNRFIVHLAISDLLVSSICTPLFIKINFFFDSDYDVKCKISRFLQYLAPEVSMVLLITIGINRHRAIVHPLNIMTYKTANKLIASAWLYALAVVTPSIFLTQVLHHTNLDNTTVRYCATIQTSTQAGRAYVLFLSVFGYVIPLVVLVALYARISCVVWKRDTSKNPLRTSRSFESVLKTRKKVVKMFLTVILLFFVTWIPLLLYVGVIEGILYKTARRLDEVRMVLYAIGLSNSVCNPFIYSFFNNRFRDGCKAIFRTSVNALNLRKSLKRLQNRALDYYPSDQAGERDENSEGKITRKGGFRETKGRNDQADSNIDSKGITPKQEELNDIPQTAETTEQNGSTDNRVVTISGILELDQDEFREIHGKTLSFKQPSRGLKLKDMDREKVDILSLSFDSYNMKRKLPLETSKRRQCRSESMDLRTAREFDMMVQKYEEESNQDFEEVF